MKARSLNQLEVRLILPVAVTLCLVALLAIRTTPAGPGTPGPITFGQPTISGIQGVGFEQDIRLDPTNRNRVYTSVPGSLSSDTSWVWHSEDGGKTFKWVTAALPKTGKIVPGCFGGGDTELAVDTASNLYFNDLTVANFSTYRSEDQGDSFSCSNAGVPDTAVDRQWFATDGDPTNGGNIYLVNDEIGPGAVQCPVSGLLNNVLAMYRSPVPGGAALAGIQFGLPNRITRVGECDEGIMGNDEVSPVATKTGKLDPNTGRPATLPAAVKHVYVIHDDATLSKIAIGRCFPVDFASDPSGLNCDDLPVATLGAVGTVKTGANFPAMAIDAAGNLYAVWAQAPRDPTTGKIGNTSLRYAFSIDEGNHWSTPITIPTGLTNHVFTWPAAGSDGRVNVAFYGTTAPVDTVTGGANRCTSGGPDSVTGSWSVYMVQTVNGHSASPAFTPPILASEHPVHRGSYYTLIGGQCGDRTLGDFMQMRVGSHGEAQIAYADSNNVDESFAPHGMYVRQNGGPGMFAGVNVTGDPILLNAASDPAGDARRETGGLTSANIPNLDVLQSSFAQPAAADCHPAGTPCYRVQMVINNMSLTLPAPDSVAVWLTQWLVPADPACTPSKPNDQCQNGGKNPFVYLESNGATTGCWSGENSAQALGGGVMLTYPGAKQITAPGACSFTLGAFGRITIDVPIVDVSLDPGVTPFSPNRLYSVTVSTMTLNAPAESVPPAAGIGGVFFDLIDVVRAYDFVPGAGEGGGGCPSVDGDGDVSGENGGKAHFHFHHDDCGQQPDSETFSDPSSGTDFHATQITSVARDNAAHSVTIAGLGTNNGLPVAFTIVAVDSSLAPPGLFSISLSSGYTNSGNLLDGSITLH
ncbi:MAG TPA: sialidase family protein [Candidatus Dormibacteraeota bacterium]|nr:sialidase family protein [Candidatus Dormibacteraeota bacterium]